MIPTSLPTLCKESQPQEVAQPSGLGQAQAPTQASNTDPLELLHDQLLTKVKVEKHVSAPLDLDGDPGGREYESAQDSLLSLAAGGGVRMDTSSPSDLPTF